MYDTIDHPLGMHVAVDQLALSLRAAKSVELQQAARQSRVQAKARRRRSREARLSAG